MVPYPDGGLIPGGLAEPLQHVRRHPVLHGVAPGTTPTVAVTPFFMEKPAPTEPVGSGACRSSPR